MLDRIERMLPKQLSENERVRQLLMTKIMKHPNISGEDIGLLVDALRTKQENTTELKLSPNEQTLLRRRVLDLQELDAPTQQAVGRLSTILYEQESISKQKITLEPPTFAGRLATFRRTLSTLDATSVMGGITVAGVGVMLLGGGLVGCYETVSNLQQLGPWAFATGGFSSLVSFGGASFILMGKELANFNKKN